MNATPTMLEKLRALNPTLALHHCADSGFQKYGKIISEFNCAGLIAGAEKFPLPAKGVEYIRSIKELEEENILFHFSRTYFNGEMLQVGICHGRNSRLNALEWHPSNELIIAASNLALFLAHRTEIEAGTFDSTKIRAFIVPKGCSLILYPDTLHFAPLHIEKSGFRAIIILPQMTNAPLDAADSKNTNDPLLFAVNKWMIAHPESPQAQRGAHVGIVGENITFRIPE